MYRFVKPITSDHVLIELSEQLNVRLDGILALPEIKAPLPPTGSYIILLRVASGTGHWVCINDGHYFDRMGLRFGRRFGERSNLDLKYAKDTGVLSKLADAAVAPASTYTVYPGAVMVTRQGLKSLTGIGIEEEGGRLSLADVKTAGSKALAYAKRKGLITDAVDLVEKKLIEKAERPEHVDLIRQVRKGVRTKLGVGVSQKKNSQG
ncbi:unnamed protein product [Phytophthora fragariaefolia]|uniref:Unnamed protein product n=1 Tax=Phytophthora fragariaefolia TaxID=1490495 RepID=A0A9W7CGA7_9STRA|nr:unnamed protein product [Phytophthora fragariaefolia]